MGIYQITGLGQGQTGIGQTMPDMRRTYQPMGLGQEEDGLVDQTIADMYRWLEAQCHERFDAISPDFCNAILPQRPVYLPPPRERTGIKWYWWVGFGYILGKIL